MNMNPHATTLPEAFAVVSLADDTFEDRRDVIDLIATMRARTIRVALFGTLIHRPNPSERANAEHQPHRLEILREQVHEMQTVRDLMAGEYYHDNFASSMCTWVKEQAKLSPDAMQSISTMVELSEDVLRAASHQDQNLADALDKHFRFGRSGFAQIITEFCNQLWASLDEKRAADTAKANQATKAVGEILTRLEYIGKHVRLVSLNASVEAARAGDAGRGLAVIATEFKTLAEEIQSLATRARGQMDTI
ncbi:MAG: methyl-accepting chemotaxis protein [Ascidiaceihabitans sp.]|jgi:hypothetical protein|nr:methyl-accepting chemotaxis protein [Ascidiaceihabitans sp.]